LTGHHRKEHTIATARFFNVMRDIVGAAEVTLPDSCSNVKVAIDYLLAAYPPIEQKLFPEDRTHLREGVVLLLDGKKVSVPLMETIPLPPDAELSFFEVIGGG